MDALYNELHDLVNTLPVKCTRHIDDTGKVYNSTVIQLEGSKILELGRLLSLINKLGHKTFRVYPYADGARIFGAYIYTDLEPRLKRYWPTLSTLNERLLKLRRMALKYEIEELHFTEEQEEKLEEEVFLREEVEWVREEKFGNMPVRHSRIIYEKKPKLVFGRESLKEELRKENVEQEKREEERQRLLIKKYQEEEEKRVHTLVLTCGGEDSEGEEESKEEKKD